MPSKCPCSLSGRAITRTITSPRTRPTNSTTKAKRMSSRSSATSQARSTRATNDRPTRKPRAITRKGARQAFASISARSRTTPTTARTGDGLKLGGVRDDSPAAHAGLKAGDRIVKLAGRDIRNIYDYTYALGEMRAGQEYEIEVVRGTEHLTLKITPAARK